MLAVEEKKVLEMIKESWKSDPPFPATPTRKITIPDFDNVWVKDESTQPTGTHKDRMAWEIMMSYYDILKNKDKNGNLLPLPRYSIISAGSAALAIQTKLKSVGLPNLKIFADNSFNKEHLEYLKNLGAEIYLTNLDEKELSSADILRLTDNDDGFDITSNRGFDPATRFYDWMSYEILNQNADYVFVPFGTGQLFENILNIAKTVVITGGDNELYSGDSKSILACNFIGATSNNPKTLAVKLYAPFRPFSSKSDWVELLARRGYCGARSGVKEVSEDYIKKAKKLLDEQNFSCEYSSAAGLGLFLHMKDSIPTNKKILIINTGKAKFPEAVQTANTPST